MYKDFVDEDRAKALTFCGGCLLTFQGVRLLTSRPGPAVAAASDSPRPMPRPAFDDDEPSLERLYQAPRDAS